MQGLTYQEVTTRCYPIGEFNSPSTNVEEMSEVLEGAVSNLVKMLSKIKDYSSLISFLEIDRSTVYPIFKSKSETFASGIMLEDMFNEEIVEHDVVICMPPKKRYTVEINIQAIRKGEPKVIEPEEIL